MIDEFGAMFVVLGAKPALRDRLSPGRQDRGVLKIDPRSKRIASHMPEPAAGARTSRHLRLPVSVAVVYILLSVATTWPLVRDMGTKMSGGTTDPVLNASILLWNATTPPLSEAWWNPPHFYPSDGVAAFTESLIGISPVASPTYWLTGNPVLAYNLAVFLTWPLSAFAAYLLVRLLTGRDDAAFLGGLVFGFSPYRADAYPHIQTLATFGVALCLVGMHGYLLRRRWPWLLLCGLAWLQQSFANGYYVLYGGLFIGLWLLYFCTRRDTWQPGLAIIATLAAFSLPLLPMLLGFRAVHEQYGLHRTYFEIRYFGATVGGWFETHPAVWLWHGLFPSGKDNLFPGVVAIATVVAGVVWLLLSRRPEGNAATPEGPDRHNRLRAWLAAGALLSVVALTVNLVFGRIDTTVGGIVVKMTDVSRAVVLLLACGLPLVALTPRTRAAAARRSPLVFYVVATIVVAVLSSGPELRSGDDVIWKPTPYAWLMALPGFNEVRVPTQLKMIDLLCLAAAAGLAYRALGPGRLRLGRLVCGVMSAAILLDGWMVHAEMVPVPELWPLVEPPDRPEPILELPLGPGDYAATFRAALHRRRVLNGVSGYDPPHFFALQAGLAAHDPTVLSAVASLGAFDIVVNREEDPDGRETRYAASAPGAVEVTSDTRRILYRVPKGPPESPLGEHWPIRAVRTHHHEENSALMFDGNLETGWADLPEQPDAWVLVDLGEVREIAAITEAIGEYPRDFPRRLVIDVSTEGDTWASVWDGPTFAQAFLGFVREQKRASLTFRFAPTSARYVRLRQTERPTNWRIQELQIHARPVP